MRSPHNKPLVAVLAERVTAEVCLEQSGPRMDAQAFTQIDQTARNGP